MFHADFDNTTFALDFFLFFPSRGVDVNLCHESKGKKESAGGLCVDIGRHTKEEEATC
jgi:hypothetical protein